MKKISIFIMMTMFTCYAEIKASSQDSLCQQIDQTVASQESIKVAASCYVFKERKILLRKDHCNHTNQDLWCLPGT